MTDHNLQFFKDEGYLIIRPGDSSSEELVRQARSIAYEFATYPPSNIKTKWKHNSGAVKHLVNPHHFHEIFKSLMYSSEVQDLIKRIFKEKPVFVSHSKISYKNHGIRQTWLPHQDSGYKFRKCEGVTIAIHLEDITQKNGAIEVFPQSHLGGRIPHEILFTHEEDEPQIRVKGEIRSSPVPVEGPAGTVVCFNLDTIHQSGVNSGDGRRPILIFEVETFQDYPLEFSGQIPLFFNLQDGVAPQKPRFLTLRQQYYKIIEYRIKPILKKILYRVLPRRFH